MGLLNLFKTKKCDPFQEELKRIEKALAYMRKWNDMPMSWQMPSLCEILGIRNSDPAKDFCIEILLRIKTSEDAANELLKLRNNGPDNQ